jgi:putrescine transport system permease protein
MTAATASTAPRARRQRDVLKIALAIWCGAVILFMSIPIALVVLHSFNRGGSFAIWSGHTSTKWWGELFDPPKVIPALIKLVLIAAVIGVLPRLVRQFTGRSNKLVSSAAAPVGMLAAIVVVGSQTGWFREIFNQQALGDALRNSFIAALGATLVAVVIGGLAGIALARRPGWWTKPFMLVLFLILVTPEIMDAIALAGWFPRLPIFRDGLGSVNAGLLRLWVGESLYASAVVTLIVRARLAGIDEALEEAAADLGAPPARAFRQITLPLISSALVAGALLSFTLCLDNTIIAQLVSTAGSSTFPVFVLGNIKSNLKPFVAAAAVVLFAVTVAALAFVGVVLKRSGESSSQIAATLAGG